MHRGATIKELTASVAIDVGVADPVISAAARACRATCSKNSTLHRR
jgi:hypothetical protein